MYRLKRMIRTTVVSSATFALATSPPALGQCELDMLTLGGHVEGSYANFGQSVACRGDYAVVGAPATSDAWYPGGAGVYRREGTNWILESALGVEGYEWVGLGKSVAIAGTYAVVGAPYSDGGGVDSGAAYVFYPQEPGWNPGVKLTAHDRARDDLFGWSVSMSGVRALIGSPYDNHSGRSDAGSAYVFLRDGGIWAEEAKLIAADRATDDYFGYAVSIRFDRAVVGAPGDDDAGDFSGSAYLFRREETGWVQEAKITAADAEAGIQFGRSVSITGNFVVIGAPLDNDAGFHSGSAYVLRRDGTTWLEEGKLAPGDLEAGDEFGWSVSINGQQLVVGARGDDPSGSAYVFRREGTTWIEFAKLVAGDAGDSADVGAAVVIDGAYALIGAPYDRVSGYLDGSVHVFEVTGTDCNSNGAPDDCEIIDGALDCNSNGVPDDCEPDADGDGSIDVCDGCPDDPDKTEPGVCGCGVADSDSDGDGSPDCVDGCPDDPDKTAPGLCGCGAADVDSDGDTVLDCDDVCAGSDDGLDCNFNEVPDGCDITGGTSDDCNTNGVPDECDISYRMSNDCNTNGLPDDCEDCNGNGLADECDIASGISQDCNSNGIPDECYDPDDDRDGDGTPDCADACPDDPSKMLPGLCGCGVPDDDSDGDGAPDCVDCGDTNFAWTGACGDDLWHTCCTVDIGGQTLYQNNWNRPPGATCPPNPNSPDDNVAIDGPSVTLAVGRSVGCLSCSGVFHLASGLAVYDTATFGGLLDWTEAGSLGGGGQIFAAGGLGINGDQTKIFSPDTTLHNNWNAAWTGAGDIEFIWTATMINSPGAIFSAQSDATMYQRAPTAGGVFRNEGTFKRAGAGTTEIAVAFNNRGLVDVQSGTLVLHSGISDSVFQVVPGAILEFRTGTHTLNAGATFQGGGPVRVASGGGVSISDGATVPAANVEIVAGAVTGSGTLEISEVLGWTGGSVTAHTFVEDGAVMTITGDNDKRLTGLLENTGSALWSGAGDIEFNWNTVLSNLPTGLFDIRSDAGMQHIPMTAGGVFSNAGTVMKSAGTGVTSVKLDFRNTGTVEVRSGVLSFTGDFAQTAGSTILNGGDVSSTQPVKIDGGNLTGHGTVFANVANNSQVSPGILAGSLLIDGNYAQSGSGVLRIELGGRSSGIDCDRLSITGNAALGGTLDVRLIDAFEPVLGDGFEVMTFAARSGDFATIAGRQVGGELVLLPVYSADRLTLVATRPGDLDGDGDVDLGDFAGFETCITGPGGTIAPACRYSDLDEDGDVDLRDFAEFQLAFGDF